MFFEMDSRWPNNWCIVECCFQDFFNITRNILVYCCLAFSLYTYSASKWCIHMRDNAGGARTNS